MIYSMNDKFSRIKPIVLELYGGGIGLDIYIKIGDRKYVKVCHKHESHQIILKKYVQRGIKSFYLTESCYRSFVTTVRDRLSLSAIGQVPQDMDEGVYRVKTLSAAHSILRTVFNDEYLDKDGKDLAKELTKATVDVIKMGKFLKKFKEFRQNCGPEYLHAVLTGFIACNMVMQFPWGNEGIKEKIVMASLLCDIFLNPDDFATIYRIGGNISVLPPHIFNHPVRTAELLEKESRFVSPETLTIIKQHHERPNGKGYPLGENYNNVTVLTAIYIISNYFVEQLFARDCSQGIEREEMDLLIAQVSEKFHSGNFKKASDALVLMFNEQEIL